jgi:hypothetical protein
VIPFSLAHFLMIGGSTTTMATKQLYKESP